MSKKRYETCVRVHLLITIKYMDYQKRQDGRNSNKKTKKFIQING